MKPVPLQVLLSFAKKPSTAKPGFSTTVEQIETDWKAGFLTIFFRVFLYLHIIMLRIIFWTPVIYGLYRFVFNFVVPILQVSRKMKQQVKDFQGQNQTGYSQTPHPEPEQTHKGAKAGDYIDFEELK